MIEAVNCVCVENRCDVSHVSSENIVQRRGPECMPSDQASPPTLMLNTGETESFEEAMLL